MSKPRCGWVLESDPLYVAYHDEEWGKPLHDEDKHFEFLLLETMQAGLSWYTILQRRENYREAFAGFVAENVAAFDESDVGRLMNDAGIIRNQAKIRAAIVNAEKFLLIQKEFGSFDNYIWGFTARKVINNQWQSLSQVPATTELSDLIAKDLKKRGFKFVGSTTIYAHLQAIGVVNDHLVDCYCYKND
jgi:DNA-3-methyladenine glycosylase I